MTTLHHALTKCANPIKRNIRSSFSIIIDVPPYALNSDIVGRIVQSKTMTGRFEIKD